MSTCQSAGVAGTSLSPEGNISSTTDVLEIVGGVVNTCPTVLQLASAAAIIYVFVIFHLFFGILESPEYQDY